MKITITRRWSSNVCKIWISIYTFRCVWKSSSLYQQFYFQAPILMFVGEIYSQLILLSFRFGFLLSVVVYTHLSVHRGWAWDSPVPTPTAPPPLPKLSDCCFSSSPGHLNQLGTYWMVHLTILTPKEQPVTVFKGRYKASWINQFILYSDANNSKTSLWYVWN